MEKTLNNLKITSPGLKGYESDFDFCDTNETARRLKEMFIMVMMDIGVTFGVKVPKVEIQKIDQSYVQWCHFKGAHKNKWIKKVVLAIFSSFVPEVDVIHEIAHIIEHAFTGNTSNRHGKKFYKYYNALIQRYSLNQI